MGKEFPETAGEVMVTRHRTHCQGFSCLSKFSNSAFSPRTPGHVGKTQRALLRCSQSLGVTILAETDKEGASSDSLRSGESEPL